MHERRLVIAFLAATLAVFCVAATAMALTRRGDVSGDDMHDFGVSFRSVGWIKVETTEKDSATGKTIFRICSAVLVAPDTAITAAHCVTGDDHEIDIVVEDSTFYLGDFVVAPKSQAPIDSVEVSPGWNCGGCNLSSLSRAGWDVAILHFGLNLFQPTLSRIYLGDMVGKKVAIVGYGKLSTGEESFDNFNSSVQDGRKMAGTNIVDRIDDFGPADQQSDAWLFDFDSPACDKPWVSTVFGPAISDLCPTEMEASYGSGDSGGPMLVQIDGQWMLTGVASLILAIDGQFGTYGQVAFVSNLTLDVNRSFLDSEGLLVNAVIATMTPTPSATATPSPIPSSTPAPATPTTTPTPVPTSNPTPAPSPTRTATATAVATATRTASPSPIATSSPTASPADLPTATSPGPTVAPTSGGGDSITGGSCGGGSADGAFLLAPLGLTLLLGRRFWRRTPTR